MSRTIRYCAVLALLLGLIAGLSGDGLARIRVVFLGGGSGASWGACDSDTLLMIHSSTTDGSTTFTDSGGAPNCPHTLSAAGGLHHETDQYKFGTTSLYFDGSGDALQATTSSADWAFGTNPFTVDLWIRPGNVIARQFLIGNNYLTANAWSVIIHETGTIAFTYGAASITLSTGTIVANTWAHIAFERVANTGYFYINGTKDATTVALAGIDFSANANLRIAYPGLFAQDYTGYMDEIRVSDVARYNATSFSVATDFHCK